jgi:hypothetical protein
MILLVGRSRILDWLIVTVRLSATAISPRFGVVYVLDSDMFDSDPESATGITIDYRALVCTAYFATYVRVANILACR